MLSITKNAYKTVTISFAVVVSILSYKTISDYYKTESLKKSLLNENIKSKKEISRLLSKYDSLSSHHNALEAAVVMANSSSLNDLEIKNLKLEEAEVLHKANDKMIKFLKADLEKYKRLYKKEVAKRKSFKIKLDAVDLKGVKVISRFGSEGYATKLQQIRVCLSLSNLSGFSEGFYVQIINPKKEVFTAPNYVLESKSTKINYTRKLNLNNIIDNDLCEYIGLDQSKAIKGNYVINIFDGMEKIHTSSFNS